MSLLYIHAHTDKRICFGNLESVCVCVYVHINRAQRTFATLHGVTSLAGRRLLLIDHSRSRGRRTNPLAPCREIIKYAVQRFGGARKLLCDSKPRDPTRATACGLLASRVLRMTSRGPYKPLPAVTHLPARWIDKNDQLDFEISL